MTNAGAEHNSLARPTKYFVSLFNPLRHNIARDLDAALRSFCLRPLARYFLCAFHIYFFGQKNTQRNQYIVIYQLLGRYRTDDVIVYLAETFGERRSSQADHANVRIVLNELNRLISCCMAFVND